MVEDQEQLTDSQKVLLAKISEELHGVKQELIERIERRENRVLKGCKELASNAVGIFDRLLK